MTLTKTRWITIDELKGRLSISKNKAYQLANSGAIEKVKIGRCVRINEESLDRWLDSLSQPKADGGDDMEE